MWLIKAILFLTCVGLVANDSPIENCIRSELCISSDTFVQYVFRRFYFIQRLKKAVDLLMIHQGQNYNKKLGQQEISFQEKLKKNTSIKNLMRPLLMVWSDFALYKDIKDQLLVEDYTKEIFVISSNMLNDSGIDFVDIETDAIEEFLGGELILKDMEDFDFMDSGYRKKILKPETCNKEKTEITRVVDIKPFISTDSVIERFYLVQRLSNFMDRFKLKLLRERNTFSFTYDVDYQNQEALLFNNIVFKNPWIVSSIKIMSSRSDPLVLLEIWQSLVRYKYSDQKEVVDEYLRLLLSVIQKIKEQKGEKFEYYLVHKSPLKNLSTAEMLEILDILADELPALMEKFELDREDLTWKAWGKKYWIPALIAVGTLSVKIYQIVSNSGSAGSPVE